VCLHALSENLECSIFFSPHQTLIHQLERDKNVRTLLQAIQDAFDFTKKADFLKNMDPTQAKILIDMLECVSDCAKFITSYAEDVQVGTLSWSLNDHSSIISLISGKRLLRNVVGQVDEQLYQYRTKLARLRDNFLAGAAVITGSAVLELGT
jgi:hypothetical protein